MHDVARRSAFGVGFLGARAGGERAEKEGRGKEGAHGLNPGWGEIREAVRPLVDQPTNTPTYQPTNLPTYQPTNLPTYQPTSRVNLRTMTSNSQEPTAQFRTYTLTCVPTVTLIVSVEPDSAPR
ncbi:MAG: PT domain-containing protein [Gemmatimonadota bacterium]|nr:PT domain-containing protein [Gemmatimonadota bacterium]